MAKAKDADKTLVAYSFSCRQLIKKSWLPNSNMSILQDNDRILPNIFNVSNYLLIIVHAFKMKIYAVEIIKKVGLK